MRVKAAKLKHDNIIKWRSHEPSRIETFSDAAFAFALTLIIVSLEVPHTFGELMETMRGTLSFAICFAALFNIWNNQNIFFRRYGLKDAYTIALNAVLLFVVLIYTYPLKFLFELVFSGDNFYRHNGTAILMIHEDETRSLMLIYGAGFVAIYILFFLMYRHAQGCAEELDMSELELYETKTLANINLLCICVCLLAISLAIILPLKWAGRTGFVYFLIPFAYSFWFSYRGRKRRKLFPGN